ncbi:MAG: peptidylprolyl isomerase [Bacteroidetes bacterium]|nr:peptidylprolyl isomerase [Bacteroidota bacterium]
MTKIISSLLLISAISIALVGCKKKDTTPTPVPVEQQYKLMEIKTTYGDMIVWLYDETPLHRDNFIKLAETGYLDTTTFHRVVKDFVIQGGDPNSKDADPNNDGFGGPGYTIPFESNPNGHKYGAVGSASLGAKAASSGSQFYIVSNTAGTPNLDGNYVVFGQTIKGLDVVAKIQVVNTNGNNRPYVNITMDVNIIKKTKAQIKSEYGYTVK